MKRFALIAATVAAVASAPAHASTPPAWSPGAGVIAPVGAATGNAVCSFDSIRIDPQQTTLDYAKQQTSGSVVVESDTHCLSTEPGIVADSTVALYQQKAAGGVTDPTTMSPWPWLTGSGGTVGQPGAGSSQQAAVAGSSLVLLGYTNCHSLDPLTMQAACRGKPLSFTNGAGTRIVAIAWTTYTLVDPRGGAWYATHPFCEVSATTFMKMTCVVAAELRS